MIKGESLSSTHFQCLATTGNRVFQIVLPRSLTAELVSLSKTMLSLCILVRKIGASRDAQSLMITGNGSFKVTTMRSHSALSIGIAQCHLHAGVLRGVMGKCIELQGFFTGGKRLIHRFDSFVFDVFKAVN